MATYQFSNAIRTNIGESSFKQANYHQPTFNEKEFNGNKCITIQEGGSRISNVNSGNDHYNIIHVTRAKNVRDVPHYLMDTKE